MTFTSSAPAPQPNAHSTDNRTATLFAMPSAPSSPAKTAYARLFWDHRRLFKRAAFLGLLASILVAFFIPVRYRATTQLMPPDNQQGLGMALLSAVASKGSSALEGLAGDLLGTKTSGALFVGILRSRTVADDLIDKFQLSHVYHDVKIEDTRDSLADHTDVIDDRKSGIITIHVTDHDPHRAEAMAQAYVDELDRLVTKVSTSSARRERIFLEGRLAEVKPELDNAAKRFSEFASKNTAIDIPAQSKAMVEAAATLQGQLIAAQSELSGVQQIYTGNNVRVRALNARIAELQAQLQKMGGDASTDMNDPKMLYPPIRKLPLLGVTYADLYRQTKIEETVYELLIQQYELAKMEEAKEIPTVKVLDAAVLPTKKSFPPRFLIVFAGTLFALLCTAGWILLQKRWNEIDPNDPNRLLAEEMGASLRSSTQKFRPVAAAVRSAFSRDRDPLPDTGTSK